MGKVMDIMPIMPPYPREYYIPSWVKALILCVILAVIFFQFHTTAIMFKWFTTTPLSYTLLAVKLPTPTQHYEMSGKKSSLVGLGAIYVALKICQQLKKTSLITNAIVTKLVIVASLQEPNIIETSRKVLSLTQNFDEELPLGSST